MTAWRFESAERSARCRRSSWEHRYRGSVLSPRRSLSRRIGFGAIVISVLLFASCGDESSADAEPAAVDAGASDAAPKDATLIAIEKLSLIHISEPTRPY